MIQMAQKPLETLALTVAALLGCASVAQAADPLIGKNYQITTIIGNETKTYTLTIDETGLGNYYKGTLVAPDVRMTMTGPKTGTQVCMASEPWYDYSYTFCFNATVRNDRKAFTTVTTWAYDDVAEQVYLYSDVHRATVYRYPSKSMVSSLTARSARIDDTEARNQRGISAFEKLDALNHQ